MKIGTLDITDCKIGNVQVSEVRIGNTLVWSSAPAYDVDAQAYFTANTAITSAADKDEINAFFVGLKADGIYTKMRAMYLLIWSSAASNKWNIKNPVDTDAAFRMAFSGGWTHASNGITGNGTNSFGNTFFNGATQSLSRDSFNIGFYSNTNNNSGIDCGADVGAYFYFCSRSVVIGNISRFFTATPLDSLDPDTLGYYLATQQNSTSKKIFKNNVTLATSTAIASNGFANLNIFLGALNRSGASFITAKRYTFFHIGDGLTDIDATNLYNRVQTLMTHFGINV